MLEDDPFLLGIRPTFNWRTGELLQFQGVAYWDVHGT